MIKTFESFKKGDISFEKIYKSVRTFTNDTYPIPTLYVYKYIDDKFWDEDLIRDLSDVTEDITEEDKEHIIKCYTEIIKLPGYANIPDLDDIYSYFLTLSDITEIEFDINTSDKIIRYKVDVVPGEKYTIRVIKDLNLFEEIVQESVVCFKRIKDKYKDSKLKLEDNYLVLTIPY